MSIVSFDWAMSLEPHWFSTIFAGFFAGRSEAVVAGWGQTMFWVHVVLVLVFLNFLPFGKHFHVLTALPAVFTERLTPSGRLDNLDLGQLMADDAEIYDVSMDVKLI